MLGWAMAVVLSVGLLVAVDLLPVIFLSVGLLVAVEMLPVSLPVQVVSGRGALHPHQTWRRALAHR